VKKIRLNTISILKFLLSILIVGIYWYWINKKLISDSGQVFSLTVFFLLMCTATAYFPLPANLLVVGAVAGTDPRMVALVGGLATLVAYLSEYIFFTILFKFNKVADFKGSWLYKSMAPLFDKSRFWILCFASFLPIPAEPLRIYAISQKYSKIKFMLAGFVGRVPRYFLLGYFGKDYVNSGWFLAAVFVFPGLLLLLIRGGISLVDYIKLRLESPQN